MKITQGPFAGSSAHVSAGLFGHYPKVKVAGNAFNLGAGEITVRLVNKEKRKSGVVVFLSTLFLVFCLVMFGPFGLLALPVFMLGNRQAVTVQLSTPGGDSVGVADETEWAILSRFVRL